MADSFPDLGGNFCVGWSGWYGYSQSVIDELKIFDKVKSDSEILADFNENFPNNNHPVITLTGSPSIVVPLGNQYRDDGATANDADPLGHSPDGLLQRAARPPFSTATPCPAWPLRMRSILWKMLVALL